MSEDIRLCLCMFWVNVCRHKSDLNILTIDAAADVRSSSSI